MMTTWSIHSEFVKAEVQSLGAMLGPAWFRIGRTEVQPFAIAPWWQDSGPEYDALPKILQRLRGEWPCVPFGIERAPGDLPADWEGQGEGDLLISPQPHGLSSNAEWELLERADDRIELALEYPKSHPVRRLVRSVRASSARPELEMTLQIQMRVPCALPIGIHPIFRLPGIPRRALLELGEQTRAWTPPIPLDPRVARFRLGVRGVPLNRIPLIDGAEDITRLPVPYAAEEIVLATGHSGLATLTNCDERYAVTVVWDPKVFPACQLWLSNRGRDYYPWNSRFLAVGIEPVCAAFDFGIAPSRRRSNPLWQAGIACTADLSPTRLFETSYRIAVAQVDDGSR
jgi:hypothetical protein